MIRTGKTTAATTASASRASEWVDVPDDSVITEPNKVGHALVWPYRRDGKLNQIRCFMPGPMT